MDLDDTYIDTVFKFIVSIGLLVYLLFHATVFEMPYTARCVELYAYPWWRLFLVLSVVILAWWDIRIGVLAGISLVLYFHDMDLLTSEAFSSKKAE